MIFHVLFSFECAVHGNVLVFIIQIIFYYSIVYRHLKQPDDTKKDSCVGIQLMGVVLSCRFPPYGPTAPVDQEK